MPVDGMLRQRRPNFGRPSPPSGQDAAEDGGGGGSYRVLRVLQGAVATGPGTQGYHPAAAVSFAGVHRWVPYSIFISVLRQLMVEPLDGNRNDLRNTLAHLAQVRPPFSLDSRFPADGFYVCIDRAPVSLPLLRISHGLALAGARSEATDNACREYYEGAREAMELLTGDYTSASLPAIYTRTIFESVFGLQWSGQKV